MGRPALPDAASPAGRCYRFGDFELDGSRGELRCRGHRVPIEPKAFDVLALLVEHRERTVGIDELLARVWRDVAVERGSVHRAVRLLRRVLAAAGADGRMIETVARRGYRFLPAVHEGTGAAWEGDDARYVGRRKLCAELDRRLAHACAGRTELILLHGPAGIGKSATLARLARSAESAGVRVLEGRCIEGPGAAPYRPWARVLRAAIRADGSRAVAAELGDGATDVARAMPEIAAALGIEPAVGGHGGRDRVQQSVSDWIRQRCRAAPLVLLFDDLHRADLDSLELLAFLFRELSEEPLLLAGAHRDGPDGGAVMDSIAALAALRPDAPLALAEMTREEVGELAAARSGEALAAVELDPLADASGGNPLFVEQLLRMRREGRAADPAQHAGLRGVLRRLLEDASPRCAEMLAQACVFGRELDVALVAAALDRPLASIRADVAEASALHLLEVDREGSGLRFVHGLIPEVLYAGLSAADRIDRHRRAVEGLLATRAHPRERIGELAHHACEAVGAIGISRAFDYAVAAARDAREQLAYDEAAALFERGLALRPCDDAMRAACLVELGGVLVLRGDAAAARPRFLAACAMAREREDATLFAHAALGVAQAEEYLELDAEQVALLREALARLGGQAPRLRAPLLIALGRTGYYADPDLVLETTAEALALGHALAEPELACRSALARASALGWTGDVAASRALVARARRLVRRAPVSPLLEGAVLQHEARECLAAGDRAGFEDRLGAFEALARSHRLGYFDWSLAAMRGAGALLEGRFADADALVERQLALGRRANPTLAFQVATVHRAMIGLARDEPAAIAGVLRPLAARFPEISPWPASLAMALAADGRHGEAAAQIECLLRRDLRPRHRDFLPIVLAMLAEAAHRLGDVSLAERTASELARVGDRFVVVGECLAGHGAVDHYRGLCAEATGDGRAAADLYGRGLALDEAMGALPFVARGRFGLARALRLRGGSGHAAAAEREVARASALATRLGMLPLARAISAWSSAG